MPDPRAAAITEQVRLDLIEQLRDLQQHGGRYIREYVDAFLGPKTTWRPRPSFHPKFAELIRELASEAALLERRPIPTAQPVKCETPDIDRPLKSRSTTMGTSSSVVSRPSGTASSVHRETPNQKVRSARRYLQTDGSSREVAA